MIFFVILWTYICILLVWIRVGQWQILHLMPAPPSLGWSQTRCSPQLDRKPSQTGLCPAQRLTISTAEMELDRIRWRKKIKLSKWSIRRCPKFSAILATLCTLTYRGKANEIKFGFEVIFHGGLGFEIEKHIGVDWHGNPSWFSGLQDEWI